MSKPLVINNYVREGKRLLEKGNVKKALGVFNKGLGLYENAPRLLLGKAEALMADRKLNEAKRVLLKLLRQRPNNIVGLKKISDIHFRQKHWGEALVAYHKIAEIQPESKKWTDAKAEICRARIGLDLSKERYKSFIFTHIQKTGGASLRSYLADAATRSGFVAEQLHIPGRKGASTFSNLITLKDNELEKVREKQPVILGDHSPYNPVEVFNLPSMVDPFFYVMVRDPIERVKSHYYFHYYIQEASKFYQIDINDLNDHDLEELLKISSNYHVIYLSGHHLWGKIDETLYGRGAEVDEKACEKACEHLREKYHCFGLFEQMNISIEILKKHAPEWLKFRGKLPQKNKSVGAKYEVTLNERVLKRIRALNKWDIKLYDFAVQLFQSRYLDENKQMKKKTLPKADVAQGHFHFSPRYKTDKFESGLMHEYISVLQGLRYQPIKLLEIGVAQGGSVNYFADYFKHTDTQIIGMDYQKPLQNPNFRENINFIIGDQNDPVRLNEIGTKYGPFDIIIDDGAHTLKETRHTYDCLFKYVKPGGYFIIEDWAAEFIDSEKYEGMIDLMLQLYRENLGQHSMEITLKIGHGFSYLMIRKKVEFRDS